MGVQFHLYLFQSLHEYLGISRAITAENLPLNIVTELDLGTFGFWAKVANH